MGLAGERPQIPKGLPDLSSWQEIKDVLREEQLQHQDANVFFTWPITVANFGAGMPTLDDQQFQEGGDPYSSIYSGKSSHKSNNEPTIWG